MFDKYLIVSGSLRNVGPSTAPTGFACDIKLGYYRGLTLSMVEDLVVSIDGEALPRTSVSFDEGPGPLTLDEMELAYERRWAFGSTATLTVAYQGGFPPGQHQLSLTERLRISYLPFPSLQTDIKTFELLT